MQFDNAMRSRSFYFRIYCFQWNEDYHFMGSEIRLKISLKIHADKDYMIFSRYEANFVGLKRLLPTESYFDITDIHLKSDELCLCFIFRN